MKKIPLIVGLAMGGVLAGMAARRKKPALAPEGVWKDAAPSLNGATPSEV